MTAREITSPDTPLPQNGQANGSGLDAARFGAGVSSDEQHVALRASVRQLGALLGFGRFPRTRNPTPTCSAPCY